MSKKQSAFRSPWIIGWISMLIIFVIANIIMIYLAIDRPGLVVDDYYDRGQDYEKNMLKRQAKVRELGWKTKIEKPEYADIGMPVKYGFRISDKQGLPVVADSVTFFVYRPADDSQDFSVPMELVEPGYYQADITFPLLGVWDILVSVKKDEFELNEDSRISAGVK
ncbi:MAG: nitrogen fixation protein FixH [Sedimenticola sp.]|jgi:nitrogen fixation protein FixH|nr:MAG: nitrogen fixation protein FixH [Sedimenticola sp.]